MADGNWVVGGGGNWSTPANWGLISLIPNNINDVATLGLGNTTASDRVIFVGVGATRTIGTLNIETSATVNYRFVSGSGVPGSSALNFDVSSGKGAINVTSSGASPLVARIIDSTNVSLTDSINVTITGSSTRFQIEGVVSGAGGINKLGTGTLTLFAFNTFSGGFSATSLNGFGGNQGVIDIAVQGALGSGTFSTGFNDSVTLLARGTQVISNTIDQGNLGTLGLASQGGGTLTYNGQYNVNAGGGGATLEFNGPVGGSLTGGTVVWQGAGGGAVTSPGELSVNVSSGTLRLANANLSTYTGAGGSTSVGSGAIINLNDQDLSVSRLFGSGTVTNTVSISALTLGENSVGTANFQGALSQGAGASLSVTKNGAGTQILSGVNSYTGSTTVNAGTLALQVSGDISNSSELRITGASAIFDISLVTAASASVRDISFSAAGTINLGGKVLFVTNADGPFGTGTINGGAGFNAFNVTLDPAAANFSLAGLTFSTWTGGADTISITGNALANTITGSSREDSINGGGGADVINGGGGNDTMTGGDGDDAYLVDSAFDTVTELSGAGSGIDSVFTTLATYSLGPNVENLVAIGTANFTGAGNSLDNIITGNIGNDTLTGDAGSDRLDGGAGNDAMTGGDGDDVYIVDSALDTVTELSGAGSGTDTVFTTLTTFTLGANVENLFASSTANFTGIGNNLNNRITGNSGNDTLMGGLGADELNGVGGFDLASYTSATAGVYARLDGVAESGGEAVGDTFSSIEGFIGSAFTDYFVGSDSGSERLIGEGGNDFLYGLGAGDVLIGGAGGDYLDGGAGFDYASYIFATAGVFARLDGVAGSGGEAVGDTFLAIEGLIGSTLGDTLVGSNSNDDQLFGQDGADSLYGVAGDDTLTGGVGADYLDGGSGTDLASYSQATTGVYARLDGVNESSSEAVGDTFISIEGFVGSFNNDVFVGKATDDLLYGLGGNDTLYGIGGNDLLNGGDGNDTLFGGAGSDFFIFGDALNVTTNVDQIMDFTVNDDKILLSRQLFIGIGASLDASEFQLGIASNDPGDRIIYNNATGQLFFDPDGSNATVQTLFATVTNGALLTHTDFIMFG